MIDPTDYVDGFFELLVDHWKWAAIGLVIIVCLLIGYTVLT